MEELDAKIIDATEDEEKLEEAVFESVDLQESLSAKTTLLSHTLATTLPLELPAVNNRQTDTEIDAPPPSNSPISSNIMENPPTQESDMHHVEHVNNTNGNMSTHQPAADTSNTHKLNRLTQPLAQTQGSKVCSETPHAHHFGAHPPPPTKLEIPVFIGEPLNWQPFWDCFSSAIDTNPSLTGVQKLSYLRAQLRDETSRVITGLPPTNLNYDHSVASLKDHYGQPQQIICAHIQALLDLSKPTNKLASLRFFHDTIKTHVRCLQSLGKSPESLDTLLVPMILS